MVMSRDLALPGASDPPGGLRRAEPTGVSLRVGIALHLVTFDGQRH
jgi:hypothetical protein